MDLSALPEGDQEKVIVTYSYGYSLVIEHVIVLSLQLMRGT